MNLEELGKKLQMAREEKKISQKELALAIGCSQPTISNYEKGKRLIYLAHLEELSAILEKPLDYFVNNKSNDNSFNDHHEANNQLLILIKETYELSTQQIEDVRDYVEFLKWKQLKGG